MKTQSNIHLGTKSFFLPRLPVRNHISTLRYRSRAIQAEICIFAVIEVLLKKVQTFFKQLLRRTKTFSLHYVNSPPSNQSSLSFGNKSIPCDPRSLTLVAFFQALAAFHNLLQVFPNQEQQCLEPNICPSTRRGRK